MKVCLSQGMDVVREDTSIAAVLWAFRSLKWSLVNAFVSGSEHAESPGVSERPSVALRTMDKYAVAI